MKSHWNVGLDKRDDGVLVWTAKCLRCDAIIVGEQAHPVTILKVKARIPPSQMDRVQKQVREAWERARANGTPIVVSDHEVDVEEFPKHDLQSALDAHSEACAKL